MDTMTITKAGGAVCGALLVFLLGAWGAESLYHVGEKGHGEDHAMGYQIEVASADAAVEEEVDAGPPFEEVFASASAADGEGLWRACASCHKLEEGANGTGPYLYGVVGRDKGSVDGFNYSETLATMEGDWTPEALNGFLENPKDYAPGNKMSYRGMRDIEDRANLIAYLASIGG